MYEKRPWLAAYGNVPAELAYPDVTLYEALRRTAERVPDAIAWEFFGRRATYRELLANVDRCAAGLHAMGVKEGSRFLVALPTCPQAVTALYAGSRIGATSAFIHPLSPAKEIAFYLRTSRSTHAVALDALYPAFREATREVALERILLTGIADYLPLPKAVLFRLTRGRAIPRVPPDPAVAWWKDLMRERHPAPPGTAMKADDVAVILFSGGTTGTPKGILLSNRNVVAEAMEASSWGQVAPGDSILALLPLFHGFGLGVCVNAFLLGGGKVVLVPRFDAPLVAKLIRTKRPSYLVGVPTLFEALARDPSLRGADLSFLKGAFCGADRLPRTVKERFEAMVAAGGGKLKLLEGYGLTETVTAVICMPLSQYREGSVGVPFPDVLAKVVAVGAADEQPPGEVGELCISGPAVMKGYLDRPKETAEALRRHPDGKIWLHTGDLFAADADGFFYFRERLKRMIKSSGMNVYPGQVEEVLRRHPSVAEACVIGVPDERQVERVKALVVLRAGTAPSRALEEELIAWCGRHLIKWSCPREVEFRQDLPRTLVGKVDVRRLQEEVQVGVQRVRSIPLEA
ncbi:MAG TPA: AMP-binding protein [Anaeromyxobacteraceae bacterium]|nr:AMP-binding protein [Anaeromyxobacteraceae bacterium]